MFLVPSLVVVTLFLKFHVGCIGQPSLPCRCRVQCGPCVVKCLLYLGAYGNLCDLLINLTVFFTVNEYKKSFNYNRCLLIH